MTVPVPRAAYGAGGAAGGVERLDPAPPPGGSVTKRTGGTTKHQGQHHAQCCNAHETHSIGTEHSLLFGFTWATRPLVATLYDNKLTLLLPTFGAPCMSIFGFLRRTSSYFHDMTLIVTRVTLTSIRHL